MTILVTGAAGLVGQAVMARARHSADSLPKVVGLDRATLDVTDERAVARAVKGARVVINCAAAANVDWCEDNEDAAYAINARAPGYLARACKANDAALLHISTDYVFDGTKGAPYVETDAVNPISIYGRSKVQGEQEILSSSNQILIFRTAWVFGLNPKNILYVLRREALRRVENPQSDDLLFGNDQIGSPTPADALAELLLRVASKIISGETLDYGVYHYAGDAPATRYDMAHLAFLHYGIAHRVKGIPTPARKAERPRATPLDSSKAARAFGLAAPAWKAAWIQGLEDLDGEGNP